MLDTIFPSFPAIICITSIGMIFGLILSVAKIKLRVEKDPRFEGLLELLPGANCGACGQAGCSGYALKIIEGGGVPIDLCPIVSSDKCEKIGALMGCSAEVKRPRKARIHCQGGYDDVVNSFIYDGPASCIAAVQIMGGFKACQYGCLGLGDCEKSCPFDAISIGVNGIPLIDWDRCTGCGRCIEACPRDIISLVDADFFVHVLCRNKEKAPLMKKLCSVGCIGCKRCIKACKEVFASHPEIETAIEVVDFLAIIDYEKCINCGKCAEVCPQDRKSVV